MCPTTKPQHDEKRADEGSAFEGTATGPLRDEDRLSLHASAIY